MVLTDKQYIKNKYDSTVNEKNIYLLFYIHLKRVFTV